MKLKNQSLPKFSAWLLERIINREVRYSAIGDFAEIYAEIRENQGLWPARIWLGKQILKSVPSFLADSFYWSGAMLKNYFKTALRILKRQKIYSFINITGLSLGLACCVLITLYIHFELSYDVFHDKADNVYRIIEIETESGKKQYSATTPAPLAPALSEECPEIARVVRIFHPSWIEKWRISYEDKTFFEENVFFADPSILEVFTFPLIQGQQEDALREPHSMIITKEMAQKYFGSSNPLGKVLSVQGVQTKVTGITQDVPPNSHFRFKFLVSFATLETPGFRDVVFDMLNNWRSHNFYSYLLLREGASSAELQEKFLPFLERHFHQKISDFDLYLQPLKEVHLHSRNFSYDITDTNSDIAYVYIFSAIALFVLIIACINYMNLTTARAANRAKEVGTRKIVGASRAQLIEQFLGESIVLLFIAIMIAFILVSLALPVLNSLTGSQFSVDSKYFLYVLGLLIAASLILGSAAGIYPALFLSTFQPVNTLRGKLYPGVKRIHFRKTLVVVQFTISISLIIATLAGRGQVKYCMNRNLGFDKENVISIPVRDVSTILEYESIKASLLQNPEILNVARSSSLPGKTIGIRGFLPEGNMWAPRYSMFVDHDFIPTMGMEVKEGRNFSRDFSTDVEDAYIINEAASDEFGWDSAVGKRLFWRGDRNKKGEVIGVVKNFHFKSLHQKIEPVILHMLPEKSGFSYMTIRVRTQNMLNLLGAIKKSWEEFFPSVPFEFFFMDEHMNRLYDAEMRLGKVSGIFTSLSVIIACLGVFGLASFLTEQRTKEIGIRKVLGATASSIVILLSKEFIALVVISNFIAWPIAYYMTNRWLQNFAYRTDLSVGTFLLAGFLAVIITLFSVGYQSVKASIINPARALRYE
jgi:putative ABC transport system permease protein